MFRLWSQIPGYEAQGWGPNRLFESLGILALISRKSNSWVTCQVLECEFQVEELGLGVMTEKTDG